MSCVDAKWLSGWGLRRVLVVGSLVLAINGSLQAARCRHPDNDDDWHHKTSRISFASFLAHPSLWTHMTPRVPKGLSLAHNLDGTLAPSAFRDYLLYRRALDATRFDRYHPVIGPQLNPELPQLPMVTVPPITAPAPQFVPAPLTAPARQTVPEPSSLLIGVVMIAGVAYVKRRRTRID